jgi:hypothetical protein
MVVEFRVLYILAELEIIILLVRGLGSMGIRGMRLLVGCKVVV